MACARVTLGDSVTHDEWRPAVEATKQFSFRLPEGLVDRVEECAEQMRESGLEVTRADVVRLLLNHALDATRCRLDRLLRPAARTKRPGTRKK
jgi:hypothetical protein